MSRHDVLGTSAWFTRRQGAYETSKSAKCNNDNQKDDGGARRNRTADLLNAIQALSQLSYGPARLSQRLGTLAKAAKSAARVYNHVLRRFSSLFVIRDIAVDQIADIVVGFLILGEERLIFLDVVIEFDIVVGRQVLAGFGLVCLLERNDLDRIAGSGRIVLIIVRRPAGGLRLGFENRTWKRFAREGGHNRILVQIVEFAACGRADALGAEFRFRHGIALSPMEMKRSR